MFLTMSLSFWNYTRPDTAADRRVSSIKAKMDGVGRVWEGASGGQEGDGSGKTIVEHRRIQPYESILPLPSKRETHLSKS